MKRGFLTERPRQPSKTTWRQVSADWHAHVPYWGHVGIYGYRADVLARWNELPHSPLEEIEKLEKLEQARAMAAALGE